VFHPRWYWTPELVTLSHTFLFASGFSPKPYPRILTTRKQVCAPIAGHVSDLMIKKWRKKRAGKWVAEDRLRAALFGAIFLIPLSLALFGVANTYIDGTRSLVVCFFCLFINGIGVSFRRFYDREEWNHQRLTLEGFPRIGEDLTSRCALTRPYQT